jgi:uncharacterized membrane protein YgdD (TMEM256/DUF423 family)
LESLYTYKNIYFEIYTKICPTFALKFKHIFMTSKQSLCIATVILAFAVIFGAFAAHALKPILATIGKADVFDTAVRYHFYHGFALLFVGILLEKKETKALKIAANAFLLGIILFCGSLYCLALTGITKMGMIAPIGGLSFIIGWFLCAYSIYKS